MSSANPPTPTRFNTVRRSRPLRATTLALTLGLSLGLAACTEPTTSNANSQASAVAVEDSTYAEVLPDTPAGSVGAWVLTMLDADDSPSLEEVEEHFAESYLEEKPAVTTQQLLAETRAAAPYKLVSYEDGGNQLLLTMDSAVGARVSIHLTVDLDGKLTEFTATTVADIPTITSTAELREALDKESTQTAVLIARIDADGSGCENPLFSSDADTVLPVGRVYDLAVLGVLAQTIDDGELQADEKLTLGVETVAPGTGRLQWAQDGATITVAEAAARAVQEADATAATLLTETVGEQTVCTVGAEMGLEDCIEDAVLTPRTLGQIAWSPDGLREQWVAADTEERAEILADLPTDSLSIDSTAMDEIVWEDGLSWYATATGICQAQTALAQTIDQGGDSGTLLSEALAVHGGARIDEELWSDATYIGSPGAGQTSMAWTLTDDNGAQWSVVVLQAGTDPLSYPSYAWLTGVSEQIIALIPELSGTIAQSTPTPSATASDSPIGSGIPATDKDPITIVNPDPENELQDDDGED